MKFSGALSEAVSLNPPLTPPRRGNGFRAPRLAEFPSLEGLGVGCLAALLFMFVSPTAAAPLVCELKSDETIGFYPTVAVPATNGGWDVHIHGCVYELEPRDITLAAVRAALRLDGVKMNEAELALFKERGRLMFADNERNHRVVVRVGEQTFDLDESAPNGHFEKEIHVAHMPSFGVPASAGSSTRTDQSPDRLKPGLQTSLEFSAVLHTNDTRQFNGVALVLPACGTSVVSDIDDTIKISEVLDLDALLRRTFLQPFEAVPGMAEVYRGWATNGAQFHYVSASPWQLHLPLLEFTRTNGFVPGSWHMKQWRLKDRTYRSIFENPENYKVETIAPLLRQFPQRRFVLVGDSGERDPEAYATLAREFPAQVKAIFIRDVTGQGSDAERYRTNFTGLPRELWRVFKEPSDIAPLLPK
jgi:hypothetical protein